MAAARICLILVTTTTLVRAGHALRGRRQAGLGACTNNGGRPGVCTTIKSCPSLDRLLDQVKRRRAPPSALQVLREETFKCPFVNGNPRVCCADGGSGLLPSSSTTTTQRPAAWTTGRPFAPPAVAVDAAPVTLPDPDRCGRRTFDPRIFGGQEAIIGSWPWVASIGYRESGVRGLSWRCAATLITSKHLITAAHCITSLPPTLMPTTVRLGELDFNRNPDCLKDEPDVCAPPHLDVAIDSLLAHEDYRGLENNALANDIGLVRLVRSVPITDFVRPICLPLDLSRLAGGTDSAEGRKSYIAGWGRSEISDDHFTPVLRQATLRVVAPSVCEATFRDIRSGLGKRICAGRGAGVDTCRGDSGGPLMVPGPSGTHWYLTGVTSFGTRSCGGSSAVYTRVHEYVDWILANLQSLARI